MNTEELMDEVVEWVVEDMDLSELKNYAKEALLEDYKKYPEIFKDDVKLFTEYLTKFDT